jgi:hypothetical protein
MKPEELRKVERPANLRATIEAMYEEYMADECCDYRVFNALFEIAYGQLPELDALLSEREAREAEIERLREQISCAFDSDVKLKAMEEQEGLLMEAEAALTASEARVKELEEGLRPFADHAPSFEELGWADRTELLPFVGADGIRRWLTPDDFRRAASLLSKEDGGSTRQPVAVGTHSPPPDSSEPAAWLITFSDESGCLAFAEEDADEIIADALPGASKEPLYRRATNVPEDVARLVIAAAGHLRRAASLLSKEDGEG